MLDIVIKYLLKRNIWGVIFTHMSISLDIFTNTHMTMLLGGLSALSGYVQTPSTFRSLRPVQNCARPGDKGIDGNTF